jgi:thymidylate kinase
MKIVLALEGIDGAGKSTLADFTRRLCEQQGQPLTAVGRRAATASPLVGRLTRLLQEETAALTPRADVFLRIAREYQRASLAALVPEGVVVLDRFVLSTLALARVRNLAIDAVLPILEDVAARGHLFATVFVKCPWEEAWRRAGERKDEPAPRGDGRQSFERKMAELLEKDFRAGILTRNQWLVDNTGSLEDAEQQVAGYLLPYLRGGQGP